LEEDIDTSLWTTLWRLISLATRSALLWIDMMVLWPRWTRWCLCYPSHFAYYIYDIMCKVFRTTL